jgi:outer membrane protein assembly factor BamB
MRGMSQRLFIGSNGNVAAIDIDSGVEIWRTKLKPGFLSATSYADVTVLDYDGKVFAGSNGHVFCLDSDSGEILWHNELEGLGHNDITLSIAGRSVQVVTKVERRNT